MARVMWKKGGGACVEGQVRGGVAKSRATEGLMEGETWKRDMKG